MTILLCGESRRQGQTLRTIFEGGGFEVVGEAATPIELLTLAERLKPLLVVLDESTPDVNCIHLTRQLVANLPMIKVICLSAASDRGHVVAMFAAGAAGCLLSRSAAEELLYAVRVVASDMKYVSPAVTGVVLEDLVAHGDGSSRPPAGCAAPDPLSSREREVLRLLAEGKSSKEIALQLQIGVATVETHRRHIMDKLNLRTIAELTKYALRVGLTSLD